MAVTYKVVNGVAPNAATETTLYTCPAATKAIVTAISWSRGVGSTSGSLISWWICDGGGATSIARQVLVYLTNAYDAAAVQSPGGFNTTAGIILANSFHLPVRWHLAATDTLVVNFTVAPNNTISFRPTILEIT